MASKTSATSGEKALLYRDKLDSAERSRYVQKLDLIDGRDPLDNSEILHWTKACENLLPSVSQYDIIFYLMFTPSVYTREQLKCWKGLDAYNQFVCGWVSDRRAYETADKRHVAVTAKVMHSQRLREKALRPWIVAEPGGVIVCSHCDCQAGLGEVCTHVSALLFSIEAVTRIRDEKTVTQKPAYWKLPAEMKKVEYNRLCEMDMSSAKRKKRKLDNQIHETMVQTCPPKPKQKEVASPTETELKTFYDDLHKTNTKPVMLSTIEPYCEEYVPKEVSAEFPRTLENLYNSKLVDAPKDEVDEHCKLLAQTLKVTEQQAENVELATRQQYKSKLWNKFRTGRVTASKARAAVKTNATSPAPSLIKSICYPDIMTFSAKATQWGCDNEETARKEFAEQMEPFHENFKADPCGFFIDPNHIYIGASPDAVVSCDCCGSFLLEIKCPYSSKNDSVYEHVTYLERTEDGRHFLKKDHPYFYQVQTQLGVTGKDMCFFVVWTTKDIHVERILFEEAIYEDICKKAEFLFESAILPELVAKVETRKSVLKPSSCVLGQNANISPADTTSAAASGSDEAADDKWCHCGEGERGKMIACDNENCKVQWFHVDCVGLKKVPRGKWYCRECKVRIC